MEFAAVGLAGEFARGLVGCGVFNELGQVASDFGVQQVVDECVGVFRTGGADGDAQAVLPEVSALAGDDIVDIVVLAAELGDVAGPFDDEVAFAGGEEVLSVVLGDGSDISLVFNQLVGGGADFVLAFGVEGFALRNHHHSEHAAGLAYPGDFALVFFRLRTPHGRPRGRALHFGLAVADAHRSPHVWH